MMTPQEMNTAIGEACGKPDPHWWCPRCEREVSPVCVSYQETHAMEGCGCPVQWVEAPDYNGDLNAMHEAEKTLSDKVAGDEYSRYCVTLNRLVCGCGNIHTCGYTLSATALQRAEAFCRVKYPERFKD